MPERMASAVQNYTAITVEVTPHQAARIALAQQAGRIRAVLRNPSDGSAGDIGRVTTASLMRSGKGATSDGGSVEFIIGGKNGGGAGSPVNINIPSITIPGITPPPTAQVSPAQSSLFSGVPQAAQGMIPSVSTGAAAR
jgi:pilus assembly protein CpaB